jgi:hypothetical protein
MFMLNFEGTITGGQNFPDLGVCRINNFTRFNKCNFPCWDIGKTLAFSILLRTNRANKDWISANQPNRLGLGTEMFCGLPESIGVEDRTI